MSFAGGRLAEGIQGALDEYMGDVVTGPWEDLVNVFVEAVEAGELTLGQSARMDHLLRRTRGDEGRQACDTCRCPVPGLSHRGSDHV